MCLECLCLCQLYMKTSWTSKDSKENQSLWSVSRNTMYYNVLLVRTWTYLCSRNCCVTYNFSVLAMILAGLTFASLHAAGLKACRILLWVCKARITSLKLCYATTSMELWWNSSWTWDHNRIKTTMQFPKNTSANIANHFFLIKIKTTKQCWKGAK